MAYNIADTQIVAVRTSIGSGLSFADAVITLANQLHSDDNVFGSAAIRDTGTSAGNVPVIGTNSRLSSTILPTANVGNPGISQPASAAQVTAGTNNTTFITPALLRDREEAIPTHDVVTDIVYLTFPRTSPQNVDYSGSYVVPTGLSKIVFEIAAGGGSGGEFSQGLSEQGGQSHIQIGSTNVSAEGGAAGNGGATPGTGGNLAGGTNATYVLPGQGAMGGLAGNTANSGGANGAPGGLAIYNWTSPTGTITYQLGRGGQSVSTGNLRTGRGGNGFIKLTLFRQVSE